MSEPLHERWGLPASYSALAEEIATLLDVEPDALEADASLLDWGLDSIRLMSLVERFREAGVDVAFVDLAEEPTLAGFAQRLGISGPPSGGER